jgi:pyruvate/2-oxoglutarate dehydrogenase complex dihydrolipoamide acyltransferase (E2) component
MGEKESREVRLPDLGAVEAFTVVQWLKVEGAEVAAGEELLEVETEKTTFVIEAPVSGRLERIVVHEGERALRDDLLAEIA